MTDHSTGAMQEFGGADERDGARPGLVLLYADAHASLPAAWRLGTRTLIGRDATGEVQLPVTAVSRVHAELVHERGCWILRDLKSRNGTYVDGRRITEERLEPSCEIRVGDAILKFVDDEIDAYARYRIDGSMTPGENRLARAPSDLVGGMVIDRIVAELHRIAPTVLSVLVLGESGTGKEVVARELHKKSGRRGQFCAVNCAAIPANLLESELFGYRRGAFTGADRDKQGLVRIAHGGTLLLDEIGDMPPSAQAKLLRVIQSKEVLPLGATAPEQVDVRIVCATHRDLGRLQKEGTFREDLYARLDEYQLHLPPLRERKEDVFMLVRALLARHGRPDLAPSFLYMTALLHHDWPYNVRELEACIKRSIALVTSTTLDSEALPDAILDPMSEYGQPASMAPRTGPPPTSPPPTRLAPTEAELRALLEVHAGNVAAVGRQLGKARMQIHRWMKRYGIDVEGFRAPNPGDRSGG